MSTTVCVHGTLKESGRCANTSSARDRTDEPVQELAPEQHDSARSKSARNMAVCVDTMDALTYLLVSCGAALLLDIVPATLVSPCWFLMNAGNS